MKGKILELIKKSKRFRIGATAVALAAVIGTIGGLELAQVPDLPVYSADPITEVTIVEEEVPLASTTTTTTSKKTTTKKKNLSKKSKKTYTKNLGTTSKKTTKTTKSSTKTVKKQTTVKTNIKEYYYKNKKYKNVKTTVTTTVKTTTTPVKQAKYEVDIDKIAPKLDKNVRDAYKTLGFKIVVDSSVNYSGYFDAQNRTITLKKEDDTVYHELGHFLAFVSGNTDTSSAFKSVYNSEKSKYDGKNKAYVIQNSSEYFAESVRDYVLSNSSLKSGRPKTYSAVQAAFGKVTTAQVKKLQLVYSKIWK